MTQFDQFAKRVVHYHPPVGLSTLFRPLPKLKDGFRPTLDVIYRPILTGPYLRFSARAALGIPEQTLLLVLMELAKEQYESFADDIVVNDKTNSEIGRELWSRLHKGVAKVGEKTL